MDRIGLTTSALTLVVLLSQYVTWSGATCPKPSVDRTLVIYHNHQKTYGNDTQLTLECRFSDKSIQIFCDGHTGQWKAGSLSNADKEFECPTNSERPTEKLPQCPRPDVDFTVAAYDNQQDTYAAGTELTVRCLYSDKTFNIVCDGDTERWTYGPLPFLYIDCPERPTTSPHCLPPDLTVADYVPKKEVYATGDHVTIECKYSRNWRDIYCDGETGIWKDLSQDQAFVSTCQDSPQPCSPPSVDSSRVAISGNPLTSYPPGSNVTMECKYVDRSLTIHCEVYGGWATDTEEFDPGEFNCPEDPALGPHCGPPNVDPSIATYNVHQDAYADGSSMTVSCKYSDDTAGIFCDAEEGVWRFSWAFTFELDCPSSGSVNVGLLAGIFAGVFVVSLISGIIRVAIRRHRSRTEVAFVRM